MSNILPWLAMMLVPWGLGALFPRSLFETLPGFRFLCGFILLVLGVYGFGRTGMPLHFAAWLVVAAAGLGAAKAIIRRDLAAINHPVPALGAVIVIMAGISAGDYVIFAWDEWSNWLAWVRQVVVTDAILTPEMILTTRGDPPGWILALAFPGLLTGFHQNIQGVAVGAALHLGLIGVVFDLAGLWLARRTGWETGRARLAAWLVVLSLLSVEASWRLVPLLQLIEEPQMWLLCVPVLVALAWPTLTESERVAAAFAAGLAGAAAWLFKTSFVTFLPSFLLLGIMAIVLAPGRRAIVGILWLSPLALVWGSWAVLDIPGRCAASTTAIIARGLAGDPIYGEPPLALLTRLLQAIGHFVTTWKWPLTLVSAIGLAAAMRSRHGVVVGVALIGFCVVFIIGLYSGMATCFTAEEVAILASHARYLRVPLRVIHVAGLAIIMVALLSLPFARRLPVPLLAALLLALMAWQVGQIHRSLAEIASRPNLGAERRAEIDAVTQDAERLRQVLAERPGLGVTATLLMQPPGDPWPQAVYEGLGRGRGEDGPVFRIDPVIGSPPNGAVESALIIWPLAPAAGVMDSLREKISDPVCRNAIRNHFLVRAKPSDEFACIAINPAPADRDLK